MGSNNTLVSLSGHKIMLRYVPGFCKAFTTNLSTFMMGVVVLLVPWTLVVCLFANQKTFDKIKLVMKPAADKFGTELTCLERFVTSRSYHIQRRSSTRTRKLRT